MIRLITAIILFIFSTLTATNAQEITGDWTGVLENGPTKLTINFHIKQTNDIYTTTMDSPDQSAMNIPTSGTTFKDRTVIVEIEQMKMKYTGTLKGDTIEGMYEQGTFKTSLNLTRTNDAYVLKTRPQDPKKPYPYKVEEISFTNSTANNIKLAGTLTLPKGITNPAVAILISGSGPQNRNEEVFNHRPFLVLADHLTRNGIAVLRYDDRGVAESEGTQKDATSADFATDVAAAVAYLKTRNDINPNKIGLIGHSEGGYIAPMVAAKDKTVNFIVSLAGTGAGGKEVLISQSTRANELAGAPKEAINFNTYLSEQMMTIVEKTKDIKTLEREITTFLKNYKKENGDNPNVASLTDQLIESQAKGLSDPWLVYFIKNNPEQFLTKVTCPVLAINGEKDFQVIPELNLTGMKTSLLKGGNKDVTIKKLPGLNHLFQNCTTGALEEYATIDETFAPEALTIVSNWILAKTK